VRERPSGQSFPGRESILVLDEHPDRLEQVETTNAAVL
jgi:hypothetical protein